MLALKSGGQGPLGCKKTPPAGGQPNWRWQGCGLAALPSAGRRRRRDRNFEVPRPETRFIMFAQLLPATGPVLASLWARRCDVGRPVATLSATGLLTAVPVATASPFAI